jgi:hypothetical protein
MIFRKNQEGYLSSDECYVLENSYPKYGLDISMKLRPVKTDFVIHENV